MTSSLLEFKLSNADEVLLGDDRQVHAAESRDCPNDAAHHLSVGHALALNLRWCATCFPQGRAA